MHTSGRFAFVAPGALFWYWSWIVVIALIREVRSAEIYPDDGAAGPTRFAVPLLKARALVQLAQWTKKKEGASNHDRSSKPPITGYKNSTWPTLPSGSDRPALLLVEIEGQEAQGDGFR